MDCSQAHRLPVRGSLQVTTTGATARPRTRSAAPGPASTQSMLKMPCCGIAAAFRGTPRTGTTHTAKEVTGHGPPPRPGLGGGATSRAAALLAHADPGFVPEGRPLPARAGRLPARTTALGIRGRWLPRKCARLLLALSAPHNMDGPAALRGGDSPQLPAVFGVVLGSLVLLSTVYLAKNRKTAPNLFARAPFRLVFCVSRGKLANGVHRASNPSQ